MALSILRSTLPRAGIPLTALRRRLHASAPRTTDDKPGIPPNDILDEYKEHRVEKATPSASINPEHQFQLPKVSAPPYPLTQEWADGDVGHDVLYDVGKHSKRTLSSFSMEGKVCVVTGAGRGLGNMMARTLVESGATQIVIVDLKQEESDLAAKELAEWFVQNGQAERGEIDAVGIQCDVASEASVKAAFAHIKDRFGRVDALVTAAGIVENFTAHEYPTDKVRKLLDINVMGTWFCALEGAKLMPEGGSIVMIGSMSGSVRRNTGGHSSQIVNIPQPQTPYNFSSAWEEHRGRSGVLISRGGGAAHGALARGRVGPAGHPRELYLVGSRRFPLTPAPGTC